MRFPALVCVLGLIAAAASAQTDPAARAKEAADLLAAGKAAAAATIYQELVAALPDNAGLKMNLGMALHQAGRPRDAVQPLVEATRADASLMPVVPSANTNIPTIMIGERVGEWVREELGN